MYSTGSVLAQQNVTGRVINGISGVPIPRVLVRLNQHTVFTDGFGNFEFQQVTDPNPNLIVLKPGFYASLDASDYISNSVAIGLSGAATVIQLYPEAIITGTVSTRSGEPLSRLRMSLTRLAYDDSGPHLQAAGSTSTNSRGEFRFAAQPGAYRLGLGYSPAGRERSDAVLPVTFPEQSSPSIPASFRVGSGELRRIDLHPKTSAVYPVHLQVVSSSGERSAQITVKTLAGPGFTVASRENRATDAESRMIEVELPTGLYHIHALTAGQQTVEAEADITVTGQGTNGGTLRFQTVPSLPIQIQLDTSAGQVGTSPTPAATNTPPNPFDFAPSLRRVDGDESPAPGIHFDSRPDKTLTITAPVGVYRLLLHNRGQWYVKSAFYGTTDLLNHDLVIGPGAGGEPIRLLVSANTGKLAGTARVNGTPAVAWVYLIANGPSAAPVTTLHTQRDGSFVQNYMPPGSYTVLALPQRASVDLTNPEVRASLGGRAPTVQVVEGAEATVDLDVAPDLTVGQGQRP